MGKFVNGVLFLGAVLAIILVLGGHKENFQLRAGNYPSSLNKALLADIYKVNPNPGLSKNTLKTQYLLDPDEFAGGYCQATNNKRYWDSPCNGLTTPPDMCGGLYKKRHCDHLSVICGGFK